MLIGYGKLTSAWICETTAASQSVMAAEKHLMSPWRFLKLKKMELEKEIRFFQKVIISVKHQPWAFPKKKNGSIDGQINQTNSCVQLRKNH